MWDLDAQKCTGTVTAWARAGESCPVHRFLTGSSQRGIQNHRIWGFLLGKFNVVWVGKIWQRHSIFFLSVTPWAITGSHRHSWRPHGCPFARLGYRSRDCLRDLLLWVTAVHRQRLCCGVQEGKGIPTSDTIFCLNWVQKCKFWNFSQHRCLHLELEWWHNVTAHGRCIINLSSRIMLIMILKYFAKEKGFWLYPHFIGVEMKAKRDESI